MRGRGSSPNDEIIPQLVSAISAATETAEEDLPPLGDAIDVDALEALLLSSDGSAEAAFSYLEWRITVTADGAITMTEQTSEHGPYVGRCNTCDEENRGVDMETAQEFFARHADRRHEVEIVRDAGLDSDLPAGADGAGSNEGATTD